MALDLTAEEIRVLGCLVEKQATTPDNYPLSSNSLMAACNQSTSRDPIANYSERTIDATMLSLRDRGLRVAIDDAGAGFASLRHTLLLRPDIVKVDTSLTRDIDGDRAKRALTSALVSFGEEMGMAIVAEGIETPEELETLVSLGVPFGQGFYLGKPGPL